MNLEYLNIVSNLSYNISQATKSSRNIHFILMNFDVDNLLHISILNKIEVSDIKNYITHILEKYRSDLEIDELLPLEHNIAFIVKKDISRYELHKKIKAIYEELNNWSKGFVIIKFSSMLLPEESLDPHYIIMQSLGSITDSQHGNYLYHQDAGHRENYSHILQKSASNIRAFYDGINDSSIYFAFHPIFSCKSGKIEFYECLLRLKSGNKILSTSELIASAEEYKYIAIVDEFVLDMAIEKLKENKEISLSVNFSKSFIDNTYLTDKIVREFSGENQNLASRFIMELTETLFHAEFNRTKCFVKKMQDLGIRIALDDFGKGYTSFHQIKSLNLDIIKIDGAFIKDAIENMDNRIFIESIVKIAQEIGALTVAEFVENGYTAKYLIDIGIDYMQGHYLSMPLLNV
jgi:EAL domain-containing protein (putative c-di-GMP-specific phosphodiesterase class I)